MTATRSTLELPVENLESAYCALIVDKALGKVPKVDEQRVNLNNRRAVISSDRSAEAFRNAVQIARGNGGNVPSLKRTFPIAGITCSSCVASVESMVHTLPGVLHAAVNLATNTALMEYVSGVIDEHGMCAVVQRIG